MGRLNVKKKYTIPSTVTMGNCTLIGKATPMESAKENALWAYNSMREHDSLPPVKRFPIGTVVENIEE